MITCLISILLEDQFKAVVKLVTKF